MIIKIDNVHLQFSISDNIEKSYILKIFSLPIDDFSVKLKQDSQMPVFLSSEILFTIYLV